MAMMILALIYMLITGKYKNNDEEKYVPKIKKQTKKNKKHLSAPITSEQIKNPVLNIYLKAKNRREEYLQSPKKLIKTNIKSLSKIISKQEKIVSKYEQKETELVYMLYPEMSNLAKEQADNCLAKWRTIIQIHKILIDKNKTLKKSFELKLKNIQFIEKLKKMDNALDDKELIERQESEVLDIKTLSDLQDEFIVSTKINSDLSELEIKEKDNKYYELVLNDLKKSK